MAESSPTRWVTFDCFGTLIDWRSGFAAILKPIARERTDQLLAAYYEIEPHVQAEKPHRLYNEVLRESLSRAASKIGLHLTGPQANALALGWASLPVFADVAEALASLRGQGYKLAVLTNCDDDLFAQTQRSFRVPFDLVVTAEQVGNYKPALAHFRFFARASGVARDDWVHIACSWFHDIAPAREFGIKRIWLDRDHSGHDPAAASLRILSAEELADAVKGLFE